MGNNSSQLKPGDTVREKTAPFSSDETGIVTEAYALDGEHRYVVKFESGREGVYFEKELIVTNHQTGSF